MYKNLEYKNKTSRELRVGEENILSFRIGRSYEFTDDEVNKSWIVCPVLVELKKMLDIKMNWEHTEYKWIKPEELKEFDSVYNLDRSLENVFK